MIEFGENSPHKQARYLQYGISGLREFWLDVNGVAKMVLLSVNANGTVDLPEDFIAIIKIAVCGADGNLHHLGVNNNMCPISHDDCGEEKKTVGTTGGDWGCVNTDNDHFRNGENVGRYFGIGGGNNINGYYKIDKKNHIIILQHFAGDSVYLEYLGDMERNSDGMFEVHPYLYEAIKAFIFWKSIQRDRNRSANEKQLAYVDFNREQGRAWRRYTSFTKEDAMQVIRKTFTPTAKT